jgi:AcrR family transcriptional regulator
MQTDTDAAAILGAAEATRARVVEVALELFAEQGFAGTSTRELSERLGFTKAALYYHFRTKDDLLTALVEPALSQLAALARDVDLTQNRAVRRRLLAGYVEMVAGNQRLMQVLSQDPSVARRPAFAAAEPLYERWTQLLAGQDRPGPAERARVRAALGGIHAAFRHAEPTDPPDVLREAALAAACGALGIPAPARRSTTPARRSTERHRPR